MKTKSGNLSLLALGILASIFIMAGCSVDSIDEMEPQSEINERSNHAEQNKLLAQIRAATAKYQRIEVAEADGYVLDPHCVEVEGLGGMGFHAVRMDLVDGEVNPLMPEALVYEPMKNGKLKLVAVEYVVDAAEWDPFNEGPPMLGNRPFDDHTYDGAPGPPFPHYQLHVWLWKHNPIDMYFPFNPNVSCE